MVQTGRTLEEYMGMGAPGVVALAHFNMHLDMDTATWRAVQGLSDSMEWSSQFKQAAMMADMYDLVAQAASALAAKGTKKKPRSMKPYPRPWRSAGRIVGRAAVKVRDFWGWWQSKKEG